VEKGLNCRCGGIGSSKVSVGEFWPKLFRDELVLSDSLVPLRLGGPVIRHMLF